MMQSVSKGGGTGRQSQAAAAAGGPSSTSAAQQPLGVGGAVCVAGVPLSPEDFEALIVRLEGLMQEAVSHEDVGWQADGECCGNLCIGQRD